MLDWLHGLPFVWLVVVVFGVTYLVAAAISWMVFPTLGVVFRLLVGFLAVQVWNGHGQAQTAVNREASALRSVVLVGRSFPGEEQARERVSRGRLGNTLDPPGTTGLRCAWPSRVDIVLPGLNRSEVVDQFRR